MAGTATVPVTVRMPSDQRDALDALSKVLERDQSDLVNEAVARFLETEADWAAHLRAGLAEAEAGDLASSEEVAAAFAPRARHG